MAGQRTAILDKGRPLEAADFALSTSPGWGTSPSISAVTARDRGGRLTVTSGSGSPGTNPTVTLTFKDGLFPEAPFVVVCRGGAVGIWAVTSVTQSQIVFRFVGTPIASTAYTFAFVVLDAA